MKEFVFHKIVVNNAQNVLDNKMVNVFLANKIIF